VIYERGRDKEMSRWVLEWNRERIVYKYKLFDIFLTLFFFSYFHSSSFVRKILLWLWCPIFICCDGPLRYAWGKTHPPLSCRGGGSPTHDRKCSEREDAHWSVRVCACVCVYSFMCAYLFVFLCLCFVLVLYLSMFLCVCVCLYMCVLFLYVCYVYVLCLCLCCVFIC
jgi:hypothetical protein